MTYTELKNEILDAIALEFDTVDAEVLGKVQDSNAYIVNINGDKYYAFESKKDAYEFCIDRYYEYFKENQQQVIYYATLYDTEWRDFINAESLAEKLVSNFDTYTRNRYLKNKNRDVMIDEIREYPVDSVIRLVDGDIAKLSSIVYDHMRIKSLISKMIHTVGLGLMLDHGDEHVIILKEQKVDWYLYKIKQLPKPKSELDMLNESKKIYFDTLFDETRRIKNVRKK